VNPYSLLAATRPCRFLLGRRVTSYPEARHPPSYSYFVYWSAEVDIQVIILLGGQKLWAG